MKGKMPKPTELKRLAGNPGHRPLNRNEPQPAKKAPKMPRGVLPREGKKFWRETAAILEPLGVLSELDGPMFLLMAMRFTLCLRTFETLIEEGTEIEGVRGTRKKHPAATVFSQNATAFRMIAEQFGLTPGSRGRLELPDGEEEDPLAALLFRRRVEVGEDE